MFEIEFYVKNAFFWGIACWNSSKITNFENFTHFQGFFTRLPIFASFGGSYGKKILKKGQMSWNWRHLSEEVLSIIWNTFSISNGKNFAICKWKKIILKAQKNSDFSISSYVLPYILVLQSGNLIKNLALFMPFSESL